ncbi:MAG TPA: MFS transporter [Candidatus Limnocylindria bacterium]|nr:MFS transporter [Candidatus Limnocylindria bacterium]
MHAGLLLRSRRFGPFFWTQFLGALNDNLFKNALVILFAFGAATSPLSADVLVNLAGGVFMLPFFLFSALAGQLADKIEKTRIIRAVKAFEVAIMAFGAVGFAARSVPLLMTALFLMGVHSAVFGPVKFGILPQHLADEELVAGNALVESGTFVAILLGTVLGGVLIALPAGGPAAASAATLGVALAGWAVCRRIPPAPPSDPGMRVRWNPVTETWRLVGFAREVPSVWLSILGVSWFWFYGALFLAQFAGLGRDVLGGDEHVVTLLLTVFSIGVGAGCMLCERLSGDVVELGLVPLGALGLTVFALDLAAAAAGAAAPAGTLDVAAFAASPRHWRLALDLAALAASGGLFIVPLMAFVQQRSDPAHRARIIAANNVVSALLMVIAAGFGIAMKAAGASVPQLLVVTAVLNVGVALALSAAMPDLFVRLVVWLVAHAVYRVERRGLEHVPRSGPAVLVATSASAVDPLVIASASRRPIRFVVDDAAYRMPLLRFVLRAGRAISIPSRDDPALLGSAADALAAALAGGELVCLLLEGERPPVCPDVARILARSSAPVVPVALGRIRSRRIEVVCGPPLAPADATADVLAARLRALR